MHPIQLRLPATSANLGPGFDALGLAMALYLTVDAKEAEPAAGFTIHATGRNAEQCSRIDRNLMLATYREVLADAGKPVVALALRVDNQIPLGMGCGSSAAALLAGVVLANHFGALGWSPQQCMEEACWREGHPDNVAACAQGYMTASAAVDATSGAPRRILTATCGQQVRWKLLLALPTRSLATEKARALLPPTYSRADAVANVQRTALLVSAFALGRGDLLRDAMQDRLHQPYRLKACEFLPLLLPLAGTDGILGVALSGAGPGVLVIAGENAVTAELAQQIRRAAGDSALEVLETEVSGGTLIDTAGDID